MHIGHGKTCPRHREIAADRDEVMECQDVTALLDEIRYLGSELDDVVGTVEATRELRGLVKTGLVEMHGTCRC